MNNGSRILRFMGVTDESIKPIHQRQRIVQPAQTKYVFQSDDIEVNVTFIQSAFVHSLERSSLSIGYLTHSVRSLSSNLTYDAQIYIELSADFVVNSLVSDQVTWQETRSREHRWQAYNHAPFQTHGDQIKPDWGSLYIAGRSPFLLDSTQNNASICRQAFLQGKISLPDRDESQGPRSVLNGYPVSAFLVLFHDEQLSIDFFSNYQRPYWKKLYPNTQQLLDSAFQYFNEIQEQTEDYGRMLIERYTNTAVVCACVTTWNEERQEVWSFMKEQSSDGDISTVGVISPAAPFFLVLGPEYLRRWILPLLVSANNETYVRYNLPWAPHHLGDWPVCSILPQDQEQMVIEETGNMLILLAAIAQRQNQQIDYLLPCAPLLKTWAQYLNASLPLLITLI